MDLVFSLTAMPLRGSRDAMHRILTGLGFFCGSAATVPVPVRSGPVRDAMHRVSVSPPQQQRNILHMMRIREHVHRLDLGDAVMVFHQRQIAGLGGRIATHVYYAFG